MNGDPSDLKHEIVIIRRKTGGGEDGHHGGAWKIAYADFVTAMMAFFLVMWLINASNEATRAQVASYFNPIKLTDSSTSKRGLTEPKETFKKKEENRTDSQPGPSPDIVAKASESAMSQEDKLMHDPLTIVANLQAKDAAAQHQKAVEQAAVSAHRRQLETAQDAAEVPNPSDVPSTDNLKDPFDPQHWQDEATPKSESRPVPAEAGKEELKLDETQRPGEQSTEPVTAKERKPTTAEEGEVVARLDEAPSTKDGRSKTEIKRSSEGAAKQEAPKAQSAAAEPPADARMQEEAKAILAKILDKMGSGKEPLPANLEVEATSEGILISLTDKHEFGMFALGSAEPAPRLVTLARAIAEVLRERPGFVVVRGHTDSKPYRNKKYDNWQLSTARAHMAAYMLVSGGLDDSRIKRIEGHADRDLKNRQDPEAPENRRIDILLGGLVR